MLSPGKYGHSYARISAVALYRFSNTMIALRRGSGELSSARLSALWATDIMRGQIKAVARMTNGTYKISRGGILSFEMPFPPLPLQTAFAERAQVLEATSRALDVAVKAEALAAALSAKVFGASPGRPPGDGA